MTEVNEKNEIEKLRRFLIKKFLLVLAVVGVAEYLVIRLLNEWIFPVLQWYFFENGAAAEKITGTQMLGIMLILLLELLINAVEIFLPASARVFTGRGNQKLEQYIIARVPVMREGVSVGQLPRDQGMLLFLAIIAMAVLLVAPYAVAAIVYARITTREVRRLEARRDEWKKEYDRRRNLMLSDIAHDLRTPITTVSGYAKALADGMVTEEKKQREYLEAIQTKSARMEELIQLLFEYVKLESDGYVLHKTELDLAELLRQSAAFVYQDAEDAGMELAVDIPEESCIIEADEMQFSRVIVNLLTNAIRHNEKGCRILLSMEKDEDKTTICVADSGEEILPDVAEHLFEPFVMGDESRNSRGGSGLGLSIAHKVVEMHGWTLTFSNCYPGYTKAFCITIK